jgi:hypothetical protein
MKNNEKIVTSNCNVCTRKGPGTSSTDENGGSAFICRSCDPNRFEAQARADIDAWLAGGDFGQTA